MYTSIMDLVLPQIGQHFVLFLQIRIYKLHIHNPPGNQGFSQGEKTGRRRVRKKCLQEGVVAAQRLDRGIAGCQGPPQVHHPMSPSVLKFTSEMEKTIDTEKLSLFVSA